jgi:serine/threonine protein kinase
LEFIEEIGVGHFGEVWHVINFYTNVEYACKVIKKNQLSYMKFQNKAENEYQILKSINNQFIVNVVNLFYFDD